MPAIDHEGARVAYEVHGQGEPAAVLLHGWCCDRGTMAPIAEHLRQGRRVVAVDLRGHGESTPAPADLTIPAFARDVVAVTRALAVEKPLLVGHSLGALVALEVDRARGHDASALVFVEPAAIARTEEIERAVGDLAAALRRDCRGAQQSLAGVLFSRYDDPARSDALLAGMLRVEERVAIESYGAILAFDAERAAREVTAPVLSIDAAKPVNSARSLRPFFARFLGGRVAGAGHFAQLEVPEQVNAMMDRFLALVERGLL
jgi:pimeloyl-ACP methyl ester carboxylesterase